jgi:hypothetical protein
VVQYHTIGQTIGCMNSRCGRTFAAYERPRHSGRGSRAVFCLVIAFAAYLLLAWTNPRWDVVSQLLTR